LVQITAADPKIVPTIIWNVSAGYITSGQNTRQIEVDTTGAGTTPDRQVRAEVWIGGYAPQCVLQTAATINVTPPATKFAEFGLADEPTLRKDLEGVAAHFSQSRESLFLIGYAGQASKPGFSKEWLGRIRDALVAFGVSARRIATVDGGLREKPWFEVWSVPRGATPPRPTPMVDRPTGSDPPARPSS
jgi:hypothetical protein